MQKLAEICIRRPVFATMLIMALVVLGLDSYRKLGVDFFPKIDFPFVSVATVLRGASPEEVESQITKKIEEAVNTVAGIDELRSISSEGLSLVQISFVLEKDADIAAQEVRDKVSAILGDLPADADPPIVDKVSTDATPVLSVVVSSPRDPREITKLVDDLIKKNIETVSGVGQVRWVGDQTRQVQVWLDIERANGYNLTVDQIRAALASQNVEVPGGRVDQQNRELTVRTLGRVERPEDFERVVVANRNGAPIRISDIATVEDGVEEVRSIARLNGSPAVVLEVRKQSGTNSLTVIEGVKDRIELLRSSLPSDFQITYANDTSDFINESFHAVQEHLILGGILASLVVFIFIRNIRATLIAAVAIPTSIVATYTMMQVMGFTLNQITMLALTLVVGVVIDDAIVVLENIFRFMEEKGLDPFQAAIQGTADIGLAVMATTFSLVIIFLPVALMEGIVGRFMSSFGYTAAFAILVSLLVSFTLTPMLCSRFLKPNPKREDAASTKESIIFKIFDKPYLAMLKFSMRHRWVIVAVSVLVMVSIVPLFMMVGKDFLPTDDQSEFEVVVRLPLGSSLEGTKKVMEAVEEELKSLPGLEFLLTKIGADQQKRVDRGSVLVDLVPMNKREFSQQQLMGMARDRLAKFKDLTIAVQPPSLISNTGPNSDVMFFLQGPDLDTLDGYAQQLMAKLKETSGVRDVYSTYEAGKPEVQIEINRDKAADLNVNVSSIANAMRVLIAGDDQVTTFKEGDDRYDVQLRAATQFRNSPDALDRLFVPSSTLGNVKLSNVASMREDSGPSQIERYNRQRQVMILANLANGQSLDNIIQVLNQEVAALNMPPQYGAGLTGRSREFERAAVSYFFALVLSIVFMYMILAAQFESFIDPVTILLTLPLSIPFALLSLLLANETFSIIYTSLGILMLFGIVKKNAILQIDHMNNLRRHEGFARYEAIIQGCQDRLRPILMTTASLVAGMLPLALGGGPGSGSRRTVAIVVIGGQSLCLLLSLLITPVAYSLFDDMSNSQLWKRLTGAVRLPGGKQRKLATSVTGMVGLLLVVLWFTGSALAQDAMSGERVGIRGRQSLTLKEAVEMAVANNLDVQIQRVNVATAQENVNAALGSFDPILRWNPNLNSAILPVASVLQAPDGKLFDRTLTQNFAFTLPTTRNGLTFTTNFENFRNSTSNPFLGLNPYFNSQLRFGVSQPLFRFREIDAQRAELMITRKQTDITQAETELQMIAVVNATEQVYWTLLAARQDVEVRRDAVRLAEEQLARDERRIAAGTLAPVELAGTKAELERRRDSYLSSIGTVTQVENQLKVLLSTDRGSSLWQQELIPTDPGSVHPPAVNTLDDAAQLALERRPELRLVDMQVDIVKVQERLNRNLKLPRVDLVASYSFSGLAGELAPPPAFFSQTDTRLYDRVSALSVASGLDPLAPPVGGIAPLPDKLVGSYGSALGNLLGGSFRTWQVGLNIDLNLRNRRAEAEVNKSRLAGDGLRLRKTQVAQNIEADVRNALQQLDVARSRVRAAEASVKAAEDRLASETRLFENGESTDFLVLTRQNELADSRLREVVSRLDVNRAMAQLDAALGMTLDSFQIRVAP
ncbi:MAG: efflux RND transporter permease subunit [Bryobacterales bacterium]|nr:efflux RND transporter permease subunit [Bryobacterales bacterium]